MNDVELNCFGEASLIPNFTKWLRVLVLAEQKIEWKITYKMRMDEIVNSEHKNETCFKLNTFQKWKMFVQKKKMTHLSGRYIHTIIS